MEVRYEQMQQKDRELTLQKGSEQTIRITEDMDRESSFMYPAYSQARKAVLDVVRNTEQFHREDLSRGNEMDFALFRYANNVISFVGKKGAGKTQTMLSFSHSLVKSGESERRKADDSLSQCRFYEMPPISPSALGEKNSILFVVLSMMYRQFEMEMERTPPIDGDISEIQRTAWELFSQCLSGIKGVTFGFSAGKSDDFEGLRDIVDGVSLRKSFYRFVDHILKVIYPHQSSEHLFLVLLIDDADSQVENGYSVLEDVRRYLVVPNLLILMSTDIEMLRNVIQQNYRKFFPDFKNRADFAETELAHACQKYIDKLIPPSHMVYLPRLDEFYNTKNGRLSLSYLDEKKEQVFRWMNDPQDRELQDVVLMLLYRKTGIIFVGQEGQLNLIVPRTLRGLNQLIYLLSKLEDIPMLHEEMPGLDKVAAERELAKSVQAQYAVASQNLDVVYRYFVYDWIPTKVPNSADSLFLRRLAEGTKDNFVSAVQKHLSAMAQSALFNDERNLLSVTPWTMEHLDRFLLLVSNTNHSTELCMLCFAISTLRTVKAHISAWEIKRNRTEQKLNDDNSDELSQHYLLMDYPPERLGISPTYPVRKEMQAYRLGKTELGDAVKLFSKQGTFDFNRRITSTSGREIVKFLDSVFLSHIGGLGNPVKSVNFMNLLLLALRMGKGDLENAVGKNMEEPAGSSPDDNPPPNPSAYENRKTLYEIQETALALTLNWDVVAYVYQELSMGEESRQASQSLPRSETDVGGVEGKSKSAAENTKNTPMGYVGELSEVMGKVANLLGNINHCKLKRYLQDELHMSYEMINDLPRILTSGNSTNEVGGGSSGPKTTDVPNYENTLNTESKRNFPLSGAKVATYLALRLHKDGNPDGEATSEHETKSVTVEPLTEKKIANAQVVPLKTIWKIAYEEFLKEYIKEWLRDYFKKEDNNSPKESQSEKLPTEPSPAEQT